MSTPAPSTAADVACTRDGPVGILELNRPARFNCISPGLVAALEAGLDDLENDPAVRVLLIRGAGKVFCTGADLDAILELRKDEAALRGLLEHLHHVLRRMEFSALPVVAAVHGMALAGGLEILMACDVVFVARSARLGDQHARYGLVPGGGNSQRLPRVVGRRRALDLMLSGRWLEADEAERWGLVNYVVDDDALQTEALAYCGGLAASSAASLATIKRMTNDGLEMSLDAGLEMEARVATDALRHPDTDEGLGAFQARRAPRFGAREV